ncbi:MAG TPA: hypothetical protein VK623_08230 [Flavobacterium sp.]|nr:hypothetical protein [Flavobacterium sp.]
MKKKLEAELISIAHRILKLKNKSELDQLHLEARKLYEKLSVLKFVEENFQPTKPTIGQSEAQEILETAFDDTDDNVPAQQVEDFEATPVAAAEPIAENKPEEESEPEEEIQEEQPEETTAETPLSKEMPLQTPEEKEVDEVIADAENEAASDPSAGELAKQKNDAPAEETPENEEVVLEESETPTALEDVEFEEPESKEEVAAAIGNVKEEELFTPTFEWSFDAKAEENETPEPVATSEQLKETSQIAFDDLLGTGYVDPVFVKPEELHTENVSYTADEMAKPDDVISISRRADKVPVFKMNNSEFADKTISLNDRLSKGITVGLNDRIAFVKNLFNNSNEDYNRVLSQLITFDTYAEAQDFIDNMVKPDYNNWEGKDEYAQRFMEVVEKKFS